MVRVEIVYQGGLRCQATHAPSGNRIVTDAPVDNQGKGESFSPTDLMATSLGTCLLTIMGIVAQRHGVDLEGTTVTVEKLMVADPLRRVGRLEVRVSVPLPVSPADRTRLEHAARTCPVHQSLDPRVERPITFHWKG
ncbi:MAG: OsmC family protein [Planctomycetota bacterium]